MVSLEFLIYIILPAAL